MATLSIITIFSLLSLCLAAKFDFEHSTDGGLTFFNAGSITGIIKSSHLELDREPGSKELISSLNSLAERDGFYVIRVASGRTDQEGKPMYASTAVRASCLASSKTAPSERLGLHLSSDGTTIVSLEYVLDSIRPCKAVAVPQLPSSSVVILHKPTEGPSVLKVTHQQGAPDSAFASMHTPGEMIRALANSGPGIG